MTAKPAAAPAPVRLELAHGPAATVLDLVQEALTMWRKDEARHLCRRCRPGQPCEDQALNREMVEQLHLIDQAMTAAMVKVGAPLPVAER